MYFDTFPIVYTADLTEALEFYRDLLGFEVTYQFPAEGKGEPQFVALNGIALAAHFGDGVLRAPDVAAGIVGAVVKDPVSDAVVWQEYLETVVRERDGWRDFYRAARG